MKPLPWLDRLLSEGKKFIIQWYHIKISWYDDNISCFHKDIRTKAMYPELESILPVPYSRNE